MGLAEDLLSQAHHLAMLDSNRPKQANLRRAISSAYYAVIHLLVSNAAIKFIPKRPVGLIARVQRSFSHGEMKQACLALKRQPVADTLAPLLPMPPSLQLRSLAMTFTGLQDLRHSADYDTSVVFSRADVSAILEKADAAFASWRAIASTDEATVFLAALAFGGRWNK